MVFNILALNNTDYIKLAVMNINSYHKFDKDQRFKLYVDEKSNDVFKKLNLDIPELVDLEIINGDVYWQYLKITIFEDYYQKDDFVIIDADSKWFGKPNLSMDYITFLNKSYIIGDIPKESPDFTHVSSLDERILKNMSNNQIGFLLIPKKFHDDSLLNEWKKLCDEIYNLKGVREGLNRQCEQMALSLLCQIKELPVKFLKGPNNGPNNKELIQSFYWSCMGNDFKKKVLK